MATRSPSPVIVLIDDVKAQTALAPGPSGRPEQGAEGMRATAATTDHLTAVGLSHDQIDHGLAAFLTHRGRYLVWVLDHRPSNSGDHLCGAVLVHDAGISRVRGRWR